MHRLTRVVALLFVVALAVPFVYAEPFPPAGYERLVVYYTGSCNGSSKTYNGHWEYHCDNTTYQQGARSGQWRVIEDTDCSTLGASSVYQVCTSGTSCNASGTWVNITFAQYQANYCP